MIVSELSFSIVIPTYNRVDLIRNTINTALNQSYKAFEVIVVDDGSTDGTENWLKEEFKEKIKVIRTENQERGAARNTGTKHASGDYVYFLDSDDLLYPEHLKKAAVFIDEHNEPEWIFQEYEIQNSDGKKSRIRYNRNNPIKSLICKGNFMSCHGVFLRKDIALKHPFTEDRTIAGSEDYALWIELSARYPLKISHVITSALIQHDERSVFNFKAEKLLERKCFFLETVLNDKAVVTQYKKWLPQLMANTYSYIALHGAMVGHRKMGIHYLLKSLANYPVGIFQRRVLAILKHLIKNKHRF